MTRFVSFSLAAGRTISREPVVLILNVQIQNHLSTVIRIYFIGNGKRCIALGCNFFLAPLYRSRQPRQLKFERKYLLVHRLFNRSKSAEKLGTTCRRAMHRKGEANISTFTDMAVLESLTLARLLQGPSNSLTIVIFLRIYSVQ